MPAFSQEEEKKATVVFDTVTTTEYKSDYEEEKYQDGNRYFNKLSDTLEVNQRKLPGDVVKNYKKDEDFWYADLEREKKIKETPRVIPQPDSGKLVLKDTVPPAIEEMETKDDYTPIGQRGWFQTLLWIVIIGVFMAVLVMYLSSSNVGLFRRKNVIATNGEEEELITEDIFAINYQKDIDKAAAAGNYRLAIRLMFLRSLKNMAERNIIRYKQDKTNLDYLMELHPTNYYNQFFKVARSYEYAWYGLFPVTEDTYRVIRGEFDQMDNSIGGR